MFRDFVCSCQCIQGNCGSRETPDRDDGCKCKPDTLPPSAPPTPLTSFGAACACSTNDGYVNTHNIECFDKSVIPKKGSLVTVIAPPASLDSNSVCTNICASQTELRGVFQMRVDSSTCLQGSVVAGYRQNISGTLVNSVTRNDFFEHRKRDLDAALAEHASERPYAANARDGAFAATMLPVRMGMLLSTFVIQDAGLECRVECANDSALCTRLNLDAQNSKYLRTLLTRLPNSAATQTINAEVIRHTLHGNPSCRRGDVKFHGTLVQNEGKQCTKPLYLDMPGIANFAIKLKIPAKVSASVEYLGDERRMTFGTLSEMVELQVSPAGAHDVVGGKIRFLSASSNEIVAEAENGCIAVSLH
jgi:hypothetical protein